MMDENLYGELRLSSLDHRHDERCRAVHLHRRKASLRWRHFAMIIKTCLLSLSSALFISAAAAQSLPGPVVGGRHLQPTQQTIDSKEDYATLQWHRRVQPEIDRLYEEVMRASAPQARR